MAAGEAPRLLRIAWEQHHGTLTRGVNWERHKLEELQLVAECIGGPQLAAVCRLLAKDHAGWSGGCWQGTWPGGKEEAGGGRANVAWSWQCAVPTCHSCGHQCWPYGNRCRPVKSEPCHCMETAVTMPPRVLWLGHTLQAACQTCCSGAQRSGTPSWQK